MQLWLLGLLVIGGISLIVFLVHVAGGSKRAVLSDEVMAKARFAEDFPDSVASSIYLTQKRDAAFLALPNQKVGLVHAVGDCFLTRTLTSTDLTKVTVQGNSLTIKLNDFTFKGARYEFATEAELRAVANLFNQTGAIHA